MPKTPEWAETECGIPARQIRALAREWGSKKVMLAAGGLGGWGGACRSATGNEWARTMVALAAMQGYGKPGINIWGTSQGAPSDCAFVFPGYAEGGMSGDTEKSAAGYRMLYRIFKPETGLHPTVNAHDSPEGIAIPRLRIPEAMMHEKFEWRGKGFCGPSIQSQMQKYQYPAPGYPFVTMYWRYGGSFFGTMQQTNRYVKAYREGDVRTVVNQSIWMEGEAKFADIILPACTNFERWDMSEFGNCSGYIPDNHTQTSHRVIVFQKKCIEPLGESKSDYDIFAAVAERMGMGDVFTEGGMDEYDWCKAYFDATDLPQITTWDEFEKKGYVVVPFPDDYKSTPAMRWFAEGRKRDTPDWGPRPGDTVGFEGLQTPSGKIEFVSKTLKHLEMDVVDPERPAMGPQFIPSWEGHHTTELYGKYPLQMVSPHPRFSFHTMGDSKGTWLNEIDEHRILHDDGHRYWIMRLNSVDAEARGIAEGDLIRAFNDRGAVILSAQLTERVAPGTVHSYESCANYEPQGEPGESTESPAASTSSPTSGSSRPHRSPCPTTPALSKSRSGTGRPHEELAPDHRRRPLPRLQRLLPGRQGRVRRQRVPAVLGGAALARPPLDEHQAQGARPVPAGRDRVPAHAVHALRRGAVPHRRRRRLQAPRRPGHHRPGQGQGPQGDRRQLPVLGHLLERGEGAGAEVHRLRPPARRRLDRDPLQPGVPHRGHQARHGRGGRLRGGRPTTRVSSATGTPWGPGRGSGTRTCTAGRRRSSAAASFRRHRRVRRGRQGDGVARRLAPAARARPTSSARSRSTTSSPATTTSSGSRPTATSRPR